MNGKRNGEGMFTYLNKDIYSGNWKNGKKSFCAWAFGSSDFHNKIKNGRNPKFSPTNSPTLLTRQKTMTS